MPVEMGSEPIAILEKLVSFETISERSNLDIVDWITDFLAATGARVNLTHNSSGTKANIRASFGPKVEGGVVLSGHTDVVPVADQSWSTDPFKVRLDGNRLYGRGTCDMKGFIAACLAAISASRTADLKRPLHLALSYDEEIGHLGVPELIRDLLTHEPTPQVAIIGEPTQMKAGLSHRGFYGFRTTFAGKAAHSGNPAAGVNAIYAATDFIRFLRDRADAAESERSGATFNAGIIRGGVACNIVPSSCDLEWEFRAADVQQAIDVRARADKYLAASNPLPYASRTVVLAEAPPLGQAGVAAAELIARLGVQDTIQQLPFCTEAGHFQAAGIPAIVCGPGSIEQAHQSDEWIALEQLVQAHQMVSRLVALLAA